MTDVHISLPPALRRALDLLVDPPADPDVSKGYLDLLGAAGDEAVAKNTGAIQAVWASPIGSMFYDNAQAISRRLISAWQHPVEWLDIPPGGTALDVGSGPGTSRRRWHAPPDPVGWRWASTSPSRCWPARSARKRDHKSVSYGQTRNDFRCATTLLMRLPHSLCSS